jgi:LasA protease
VWTSINRLVPGRSGARRIGLYATLAVLAGAAAVSAPASAAAAQPSLRHDMSLGSAVDAAILDRAGMSAAQARAAGRSEQVNVQRHSDSRASGSWAFGTAILTAPARAGEYPSGWLFLAHQSASGQSASDWQVALDGSTGFADLARQAPAAVLSTGERAVITPGVTTTLAANSTNNPVIRLPYAIGQAWTLTGGPHGWSGSDTPYSSVDLSGGDTRVLAAGGGLAYRMCASTINGQFGGWMRIYHSNGYATDYYHLWNVINPAAGSSISEGAFLGNTGTNTCAGGSASGRHVHFAIGIGTPSTGVTRVAWNWRVAGKWVFWQGSSPYQGYALHGSTHVNVGGTLYNYGALGSNQGIVDAWDSATVNERSGPGTNYSIVGSLSDGTTVTISCWRNGTTHTGRYGTTAVWDKLSDGHWASDAFIYTGTNTIGPQC